MEKTGFSLEALVVVVVGAVLVIIGICAVVALLRRKRGTRETKLESAAAIEGTSSGGRGSVKEALMGTVVWSRGIKLGEEERESLRLTTTEVEGGGGGEWRSFGSTVAPLWQRRILMGERCEMPTFSGLILYDERGRAVHPQRRPIPQEKAAPVASTTLRDLFQ